MPIPAIAAMAARSGTYAVAGSMTVAESAAGATYGVKSSSAKSSAKAYASQFEESTKKAGDAAKGTTAATQGLSQSFDQFRNSARRAAVDFYIAKAAIVGLSSRVIGTLTAPLDLLTQSAEPLVHLVKLANPAVAERFNFAMENAYSAIGRIVQGPLQAFSRIMQSLGNTYAKMEPILRPTADHFGRMAEAIGNQLFSAIERSGPLIAGIASAFELLVDALVPAAPAIDAMITALQMSTGLLQALGAISGRKVDPNRQAMAVRSVSIGTSGEEISRQAQAKAFTQALGSEKLKQEDVPDLLDKIWQWLDQKAPRLILDLSTGIVTAIEQQAMKRLGEPGKVAFDANFGLFNLVRGWATRTG